MDCVISLLWEDAPGMSGRTGEAKLKGRGLTEFAKRKLRMVPYLKS